MYKMEETSHLFVRFIGDQNSSIRKAFHGALSAKSMINKTYTLYADTETFLLSFFSFYIEAANTSVQRKLYLNKSRSEYTIVG